MAKYNRVLIADSSGVVLSLRSGRGEQRWCGALNKAGCFVDTRAEKVLLIIVMFLVVRVAASRKTAQQNNMVKPLLGNSQFSMGNERTQKHLHGVNFSASFFLAI